MKCMVTWSIPTENFKEAMRGLKRGTRRRRQGSNPGAVA
jgi:hypothetical protein